MADPQRLASLWAGDRATVGLWHRLGTAQAAGIVGRAGFDWVCIDAQHGFIDAAEVRVMLGGLLLGACPGIVRTPWHDPGFAMKVLDAGASGILFPTIEDPEQARQAVAACRFPPAGYRSWAGLGRDGDRPAAANEAVSCGVMIETQAALRNLEAILDVPGVDFAFVGPDDLAISLGHAPTTEPTEPEVLAAIERVRAACGDRGLPAGIYCGSPAMVRRWAAAGFRILAAASDTTLLAEATAAAARAAVEAATALRAGEPAPTGASSTSSIGRSKAARYNRASPARPDPASPGE